MYRVIWESRVLSVCSVVVRGVLSFSVFRNVLDTCLAARTRNSTHLHMACVIKFLFRTFLYDNHAGPVFEAMLPLPRSMESSLLALLRSCHDLAMILARIPWPCKIVQRLTMINHDLGKGSMVPLAKFLENSEPLFSNYN